MADTKLPYTGRVTFVSGSGISASVAPDEGQIVLTEVVFLNPKAKDFKVGDRVRFSLMDSTGPYIDEMEKLTAGEETASKPTLPHTGEVVDGESFVIAVNPDDGQGLPKRVYYAGLDADTFKKGDRVRFSAHAEYVEKIEKETNQE